MTQTTTAVLCLPQCALYFPPLSNTRASEKGKHQRMARLLLVFSLSEEEGGLRVLFKEWIPWIKNSLNPAAIIFFPHSPLQRYTAEDENNSQSLGPHLMFCYAECECGSALNIIMALHTHQDLSFIRRHLVLKHYCGDCCYSFSSVMSANSTCIFVRN